MKKLAFLLLALLTLSACTGPEKTETPAQTEADAAVQLEGETQIAAEPSELGFVTATEITQGGSYTISGPQNGAVYVDAKGERVELVLDGAKITGVDSPGIWIAAAKEVTITVAGRESTVSVPADLTETETVPNAAIYSKADLILTGAEGAALTVEGAAADAVNSRDTLTLQNLTLNITAADDGLVGKDSVLIQSCQMTLTTAGDGIKSTNDVDPELGSITLEDSQLTITAGDDAVQAFNLLTVHDGQYTLNAGKDGFKAGTGITLSAGSFFITADRDAFRMDTDAGLLEKTGLTLGEGTVLAAGLTRGSVLPASCSGQPGALFQLASQEAGTAADCTLQDGSILSMTPEIPFTWALFSAPQMAAGEDCALSLNDQSAKTGTLNSGGITVR